MQINDSVAFVTGANRGLGRALVEELLARGARRVYAAARDTTTLEGLDGRVVPVALDVTQAAQAAAAAAAATDTTLLINNAGTARFADPFSADPDAVRQEWETNYLGTFEVIRAFAPVLERTGGSVVNILSMLSLASIPAMAGYSASKAAAHSLTQAVRPLLAARGVSVHGVYPGGIDTDMIAGVETPKTHPKDVASGILDAVEAGQEDIYPDPTSAQMSGVWSGDPKAFERAFAGM
jgi:NAD(P)-dependent dehydrogenase (short-subunit alcohol dehydrogenase family)